MTTKEQQALEERRLIRWQMWLGSGLIAFGALSIPLFQVSGVLDGQAATAAFAVTTGVIGAGAAMLPTGAAAGASARILRSLPDNSDEADDQRGALNGRPDKNLVVTVPEASRGPSGQASPGRPVTCPGPCVNSGPRRTGLASVSLNTGNGGRTRVPSRVANC